ncbi:MAG TPA: PAS domain S-box protein [Caulobacteraceae bacterium]|nr:PAS domain S-box protein [Caulobacteraceae bacterium]
MHDIKLNAGAADDRSRLLLDAIADYAIYMLDRDGRVTSWNVGAERLKGYSREEILGRHFSIFYTPEDIARDLPATALQTAAREGRFELEGWRMRRDGKRFWANVIVDPIRTATGELIGYAKITRDLTEKRAAEAAVLRSEQQFRLLVQGVTDYAIYMLDPSGRVASWNAGAQRIKGYAPHEIIGEHFSRFYTDEDRAAGWPARGLATASSEGRWEHEGLRVRKDGSRFWAHVIIDAIRDESGQIAGFAKITRDITERREAQRALEDAQQALMQSQKLEAIGQLTGGVAHDFNNLLMAVLGSLELLRKRLPPDPRAHLLVDNAEQAATRGAALTQRMLAFARRQELEAEAIDVPALVSGMHDLLQRSIGPEIQIRTRFEPDLPVVLSDANQVEIALLNLAVNGRDAMPEGGELLIEAAFEALEHDRVGGPRAGRYVKLCVTDTGIGMDPETLARAAEPFFTTKGPGKGTGLGLSMVHGLAEQCGGRLVLDSEPGHGVTATLWLPAAQEGVEAAPQPPPAARSPPVTQLRTVMAVDDDPLVLTNTAAMLEDLGYRVIALASGAGALKALADGAAPDLLFTDQAMPGMTGVELARAAQSLRPDLPVLLTTGYAEMPPGSEALAPRLKKPFTQSELAEALAEVAAGA